MSTPPTKLNGATKHPTIPLTRFSSPVPIGKRLALDEKSKLKKTTQGRLSRGVVETLAVHGLEGLRDAIAASQPTQAFAFGVMRDNRLKAELVTDPELKEKPNPRAIARTKEYFEFPVGVPGFLFLDFDSHHAESPLTDLEAVRGALYSAVPALRGASLLWRLSSSAHVVNSVTKEDLTGVSGQHVYIPVADASDITRAGKALFERLWLAGFGHYGVSKSGVPLRQTIVDRQVWGTQGLVFVSEPELVAPLERIKVEMQLQGDPHALFDTRQIEDLNADESKSVAKLDAAARLRVAPAAKLLREAWVTERLKEYLKKHKSADRKLVTAMFYAAVEQGVLMPDFVLHPETGGAVTVAEVLKDPTAWHGRRFADPLDPDYHDDKRIAMLNTRTGSRYCIHSWAHGGQNFYLQPERAIIEVTQGNEYNVTTQVLHVIREGKEIYEISDHGLVRVRGGRLEPVTPIFLHDYIGLLCSFRGYDKKAKKLVAKNTPPNVAKSIMERHGERHFLPLDALITAPAMRLNGLLIDAPGYDAASRLFYYSAETEVPAILVEPSLEQARSALDKLWSPFSRFDFIDAQARGVVLAAILTSVTRAALPTAPGFAFDAPTGGSGKTLLSKTLAAFAGTVAAETSPPANNAECAKSLFSCLRAGEPLICYDNFVGPIDGDEYKSLCTFLTAANFRERVLGISENETLPNRAVLLLTGNNIRVTGDLIRRVLVARLDTRLESPIGRRFLFNPETMVREDRIGYVCAALTVIRAAITHGDTFDTHGLGTPYVNSSTGSYDDWDRLIRQTVGWVSLALESQVTFGDPTAGILDAATADPRKDALRDILLAWQRCFGDEWRTCRDAWQYAGHGAGLEDDCTALYDSFHELDTHDSNRRFDDKNLARWMATRKDQVVDGLRFEQRKTREKKNEWRVVRIS